MFFFGSYKNNRNILFYAKSLNFEGGGRPLKLDIQIFKKSLNQHGFTYRSRLIGKDVVDKK